MAGAQTDGLKPGWAISARAASLPSTSAGHDGVSDVGALPAAPAAVDAGVRTYVQNSIMAASTPYRAERKKQLWQI